MSRQEKRESCPICGKLRGERSFCGECGWDFTTEFSESVLRKLDEKERKTYGERIRILKKIYEGYKKSRDLSKKRQGNACEKQMREKDTESAARQRADEPERRKGTGEKQKTEPILVWEKGRSSTVSEQQGKRWRDSEGHLKIEEGYKKIGDHAFEKCRMSEVTLPETVETIGKMAFYWCESLQKIQMPHVKKIGVEAFMGCRRLESIELPEGLEEIATSAFAYCDCLKEVKLPSTLRSMAYTAFLHCTSLKTIYLAPGVSEKLTEQLKQMRTSAKIEQRSIEGSQSVKTEKKQAQQEKKVFDPVLLGSGTAKEFVKIPEGYQKIKERAFEGWSQLQRVWMPDSIEEIGANAFYGCSHLAQIRWSNRLKIIGAGAFSGCWKLKRIRVPDGTAEIGNAAFSACRELETVQLPASVRKVGMYVFLNCGSLKKIQTGKGMDGNVRDMLEKECIEIE